MSQRRWCVAAMVLAACGGVDARSPGLAADDAVTPGGGGGNSGGAGGSAATPGTEGGAPGAQGPDDPAGGVDSDEAGAATGGVTPAGLTSSATAFDFGRLEVGVASERAFEWVITNTGEGDTGPLSLVAPSASPFSVSNGCTSLAAGAACSIGVSVSSAMAGIFGARLRLDSSGGSLELDVTARGQHRLTVSVVGRGDVTSEPAGLACSPGACTGLFDPGTITLTARTQNGTGSFRAQWDDPACHARQTCTAALDGSRSVGVRFADMTNNLVFVSSEAFAPDLGGLAAYDAACNRLATAAGINDASGDSYIAAMSDSTSSLRQRLTGARGWVRMDGLPVADTVEGLFDRAELLYPIAWDENGQPTPDHTGSRVYTLTGTLPDGTSSPNNCADWTSSLPTVQYNAGRPAGGPTYWMLANVPSCEPGETPNYIFCMGVRRAAPLVAELPLGRSPATGKLIWSTSTPFVPGTMTPDARCQSELPAGVAEARAFVGYSDRPAADVLEPDANYFRPDGVLVGSGAELAALELWGAPWAFADGTAAFVVADPAGRTVFTGALDPTSVTTLPDENCDDWTDSSMEGLGTVGDYGLGNPRFFNSFGRRPCALGARLYCVEL